MVRSSVMMAWSLQRLGRLAVILPLFRSLLILTAGHLCKSQLELETVFHFPPLLITFGCRTWWRPSSEKSGANFQLSLWVTFDCRCLKASFQKSEEGTLVTWWLSKYVGTTHHHQFVFQISEISITWHDHQSDKRYFSDLISSFCSSCDHPSCYSSCYHPSCYCSCTSKSSCSSCSSNSSCSSCSLSTGNFNASRFWVFSLFFVDQPWKTEIEHLILWLILWILYHIISHNIGLNHRQGSMMGVKNQWFQESWNFLW